MAAGTEARSAPSMAAACQAAEELAEKLRTLYPEYRVVIGEHIRNRYEVVIEMPFHPWEGR